MTTTYTLRNASPAKTRTEAVVVGVLSSDKGPVVCDAGADVAQAWGRKWLPLLSSLGFSGKAGEAIRIPTGGMLNASMLVLVGLGSDPDGTAVRRAAGVAARNVPNAASVALADTMYRAGSGDASVLPSLTRLAVDRSNGMLVRASAVEFIEQLVLGIADGWLEADGTRIYEAKDLRVALFQAQGSAAA